MLLILKIYRLGEMVAFAFFRYGRNVQNINFLFGMRQVKEMAPFNPSTLILHLRAN
jgi:hypothetical protein